MQTFSGTVAYDVIVDFVLISSQDSSSPGATAYTVFAPLGISQLYE